MESYNDASESESKEIHDLLLRDPDENFILFSKKILGTGAGGSLPIGFELMLLDKSPEQLVQEVLEYYCNTSVEQFKAFKGQNLKRKRTNEIPEKTKKKKVK